MCRIERWSVRTLRQKIDRLLFERTAVSKKPEELIRRNLDALQDEDRLTRDLVFRDPYFLDLQGFCPGKSWRRNCTTPSTWPASGLPGRRRISRARQASRRRNRRLVRRRNGNQTENRGATIENLARAWADRYARHEPRWDHPAFVMLGQKKPRRTRQKAVMNYRTPNARARRATSPRNSPSSPAQ